MSDHKSMQKITACLLSSYFTRNGFWYISFSSQTGRSEKVGIGCNSNLGGAEEAPTFLGLDFKNFGFFPRGKVFEVGAVFCCRVRQKERGEDEREGGRE